MAEKFIIQGRKTLHGEVNLQGSKNEAGPVLAACLLTKEECIINNLPLIDDIHHMLEIFESMGVKVQWLDKKKVSIKAETVNPETMNFEKVSKVRISVLLFGALLGRCKHFKISHPGGDRIGVRPISVHLRVLEQLGAHIKKEGDFYEISRNTLKGAEVVFHEASVTATETLLLAAASAEGKTIIKGGALEPHVQHLAGMLSRMGIGIQGIGTYVFEIEGSKDIKGVSFDIASDPIEAATYFIAGALMGNKVVIKNAGLDEYFLFLEKMQEIGVPFSKEGSDITVSCAKHMQAVKIQALPYPGFPTDFLPLVVPLLVSAKGKSLMHDPMYEGRFQYVQQLRKMGADIEIVDPHRTFVFGPSELLGLTIESWDIRAGACLVIAGLMAEGKTTIENIEQIDRGYEKIEEKLQALGADIKRIL